MSETVLVSTAQPARGVELRRRGGRGGVYVFDPAEMAWQDAGKAGVAQKIVRRDGERGWFLGLIGMEPTVRSGLHQHQGVATSYFVDGGLTDYQGAIRTGEVGINLKGATHDAITYARTLFVARLQGPVTYPPQDGPLHALHAGARHAVLVNPAPEVPPDINVAVDALVAAPTGLDGVERRMVFDYAGTGDAHRMVQLSIRPQVRVPRLRATDHVELWVRGGLLEVDGRIVHAGCFVVIEPGAEFELASPFGALLLGWAEGTLEWVEPPAAPAELFGFD
ncbi:MAG: hypothetical protein NTW15_00575 [Burkholderiales bacterium]|nr:hypothetical protein [Burkholderiales bacterium]